MNKKIFIIIISVLLVATFGFGSYSIYSLDKENKKLTETIEVIGDVDSVEELAERIVTLNAYIESYKERIATDEALIAQYIEREAEYLEEVKALREDNVSHTEEITELEKTIAELTEAKAELQQEILDLQSEISDLESQIDELWDIFQSVNNYNEELENADDTGDSPTTPTLTENQVSVVKNYLSIQYTNYDNVTYELAEVEAEQEQVLTQINTNKTEAEDLTNTYNSNLTLINKKEAEKEANTDNYNNNLNLIKDLNNYINNNKDDYEAGNLSDEDAKTYEEALIQLDLYIAKNDAILEANVILDNEIANCKAENELIEIQLADIESEVETLVANYNLLQEQVDALNSQLDSIQEQIDMFTNFLGASDIVDEDTGEVIHSHTAGEAVIESYVEKDCKAYYDEVVYCTECGEKISILHITEDLEHTPSEEVVIENETTNTVDGITYHEYDEVVYCTVCGEKISINHISEKSGTEDSGDSGEKDDEEETTTLFSLPIESLQTIEEVSNYLDNNSKSFDNYYYYTEENNEKFSSFQEIYGEGLTIYSYGDLLKSSTIDSDIYYRFEIYIFDSEDNAKALLENKSFTKIIENYEKSYTYIYGNTVIIEWVLTNSYVASTTTLDSYSLVSFTNNSGIYKLKNGEYTQVYESGTEWIGDTIYINVTLIDEDTGEWESKLQYVSFRSYAQNGLILYNVESEKFNLIDSSDVWIYYTTNYSNYIDESTGKYTIENMVVELVFLNAKGDTYLYYNLNDGSTSFGSVESSTEYEYYGTSILGLQGATLKMQTQSEVEEYTKDIGFGGGTSMDSSIEGFSSVTEIFPNANYMYSYGIQSESDSSTYYGFYVILFDKEQDFYTLISYIKNFTESAGEDEIIYLDYVEYYGNTLIFEITVIVSESSSTTYITNLSFNEDGSVSEYLESSNSYEGLYLCSYEDDVTVSSTQLIDYGFWETCCIYSNDGTQIEYVAIYGNTNSSGAYVFNNSTKTINCLTDTDTWVFYTYVYNGETLEVETIHFINTEKTLILTLNVSTWTIAYEEYADESGVTYSEFNIQYIYADESSSTGVSTATLTYTFEVGMTFKNWINSDYNTNGWKLGSTVDTDGTSLIYVYNKDLGVMFYIDFDKDYETITDTTYIASEYSVEDSGTGSDTGDSEGTDDGEVTYSDFYIYYSYYDEVSGGYPSATLGYIFEVGMTFKDWINSDYNTSDWELNTSTDESGEISYYISSSINNCILYINYDGDYEEISAGTTYTAEYLG